MVKPFASTLKEHTLTLKRSKTSTIQINVGLACNLACKHCHLGSGPHRDEMMTRQTMDDVIQFIKRNDFEVADITGGAPELVPGLSSFLNDLSPLVKRVLLRSNLTLLLQDKYKEILESALANKVAIIASFPSVNKNQTSSQRGDGVWEKTIESLKILNELGYGMPDTTLELILVSNPSGAFMPVEQCKAETKFRKDLAAKWGIQFTSLFTFANVPLGRFKSWLEKSNNYQSYLNKLSSNFNPATVQNLMCRTLISISWDGYLFDCDFNQAAGLHFNSKPVHVTEIETLDEIASIATDNHCYACTAGAGFT